MSPANDQLCPSCGRVWISGAQICECGYQIPGQQSVYAAYPRQQMGATAVGNPNQDAMAIAGMVCGIFAVLTVCVWPLSVLCSLAGIILSAVSLKSKNRGMAIAGLICSISAFVLIGLLFVGLYALFSSANQYNPTIK